MASEADLGGLIVDLAGVAPVDPLLTLTSWIGVSLQTVKVDTRLTG